jgi:hypothetical protein
MFNTPVLFLIYKRPEQTRAVFNAIREIKPQQLFVAADGPKANATDADLCRQVRSIATNVDWPCEVHTLFRDTNMGSGPAVSEAITWFFDHVEQGIILEDDCLPDESFFNFCDILLNKHARSTEIMAISGTNLLREGWKPQKQSYFFGHGGVWGWATWKRAWSLYDYDMATWASEENKDDTRRAMHNDHWFEYYYGMFEGAYRKELDAWDLQWFHCILNNKGLSINPSVNLVRNIGFGPGATHTTETEGPYANLELKKMAFPLKHPAKHKIDTQYLRTSYRAIKRHDKTLTRYLKFWARLYLNKFKKKLGISIF